MTTSRQAQLLAFIRERIAATEVCPSYEEMAKHLGLASKSGVYELIRRLEERGHVRRLPDRARAIEVVDRNPPRGEATLAFTLAEKVGIVRALAPTRGLREIADVLVMSPSGVWRLAARHGIKTKTMSDGVRLAWATPGTRENMLRAVRKSRRKHSDALRARVKSLKGIMSASMVAAQFGFASRNVTIGIWNRP